MADKIVSYPTPEELAHWREVWNRGECCNCPIKHDETEIFHTKACGTVIYDNTFDRALVLRLLALAEHAGVMREALEWIACPPEDEFIGQGPAVCIKKARAALAQCEQGEKK